MPETEEEQRIRELEREVESLEDDKTKLQDRLADAKSEIDDLQEKIRKARGCFDDIADSCKSMLRQLDAK